MPYFNESQLEMSIVTLLQEQGYDYVKGEDIVRNLDEVVLRDVLAQYLRSRYKNDGITEQEVEAAIRVITQRTGGSLYEENRHTMNLLMDGFSLKREDATRQNLYIQPIAFEESQQKHNIFKVVNQYDIVGNQHRIPDAIIFLNGLPVVVFEFKSAIKQNTTIEDGTVQIDYPRLILSTGPIAPVGFTNCHADGLHVELQFEPYIGANHANLDDVVFIYAVEFQTEVCQLVACAERRTAGVAFDLPDLSDEIASNCMNKPRGKQANRTNALTHSHDNTFNYHLYAIVEAAYPEGELNSV